MLFSRFNKTQKIRVVRFAQSGNLKKTDKLFIEASTAGNIPQLSVYCILRGLIFQSYLTHKFKHSDKFIRSSYRIFGIEYSKIKIFVIGLNDPTRIILGKFMRTPPNRQTTYQ